MIARQPQAPSAPHTAAAAAPSIVYRERQQRYAERRDRLNRLSAINGNISLALLAAALLSLGSGLYSNSMALVIAAALFGLAFIISYVIHGRVDQVYRRYVELHAINSEALLRLERRWEELPLLDRSTADPAHPYAGDLDLMGNASLLHLLAPAATPTGQALLRRWLLEPAPAPEVRERQAAAAELAPAIDLREVLMLRVRLSDVSRLDPSRFLAWAEDEDWLPSRSWLLWVARLLPLLIVGSLFAQPLLGLSFPLWLALAAAGLLLTLTIGGQVDEQIDRLAARHAVFSTYADLFNLVGSSAFAGTELRRLQATLAGDQQSAARQMRRLGRIMALNDVRGWLPFFLVQITTLWNVHLLWLLERWRRSAGGQPRQWIAALAELEALQALAMLTHDHPAWTFPILEDNRGAALQARGLGHPLLPPETRVSNDVEVGPPGSMLLITGSNMSGKSTLLRAIGVNIVLAQAGAPVCAARLSLPPLALATSMRVQDSLQQGVSYFMAELQRLRVVVEAARREAERGERTLLFLLDEILHGTNTSERQIAVRQVVLHLLGHGAMGAISTHDLSLAELPEIAAVSTLVHFREEVSRGDDGLRMRFDYKLRPGIASSTNALVLVEQVLGRDFTDAPEDSAAAHGG